MEMQGRGSAPAPPGFSALGPPAARMKRAASARTPLVPYGPAAAPGNPLAGRLPSRAVSSAAARAGYRSLVPEARKRKIQGGGGAGAEPGGGPPPGGGGRRTPPPGGGRKKKKSWGGGGGGGRSPCNVSSDV